MRRGLPLALLWAIGASYLALVARYSLAGVSPGNDFAAFYAASRLVLDGHAGDVFDMARMVAMEHAVAGGDGRFPWAYPPVALLFVAPLGLVPYLPALAAWLAATTLPLLLIIRRLTGLSLAVAAIMPAIAHNLSAGQNGALTATLLAGGAALAGCRRPWIAGIMFGLAAYKPQACILIPVCLLAARRYDALAAMAATVSALVGLSFVLFGWGPWEGFLVHLGGHMDFVAAGKLPFNRFPTMFAAVLKLTGERPVAEGAQVASTMLAGLVVWRVWRGSASLAHRLLALAVAMPLATPFLLEYDLALTAVPAAFIFQSAWRGEAMAPVDWAALVVLWVLPPMIWAASLEGLAVGLPLAALLSIYAIGLAARSRPSWP